MKSSDTHSSEGTSCNLTWREDGNRELVWVCNPAHPIAKGIDRFIKLEHEETYGEPFGVPEPDENGEFDKPLTIYKTLGDQTIEYNVPLKPADHQLFYKKIRSFIERLGMVEKLRFLPAILLLIRRFWMVW